jgi:hypothetical protein
LKDKYQCDYRIPFCKQLNKDTEEEKLKKTTKKDQPLTPRQAADSRLVSKVRYIIEFINAKLKLHEALDYVRNTRLGYLFVEYRIMCAMINFTHKPNLTDKPNTVEVANLMRSRCQEPQFNDLEFLLNKQLGTNLFEPRKLQEITNFVSLKRKQMTRYIFTGTFHLRRAKSYLVDLVNQDSAFTVNMPELNKIVNKLPDSENYRRLKTYICDPKVKILVTKVASRHKRAVEKNNLNELKKKPKPSAKSKKARQIKNLKVTTTKVTTTNENLAKIALAKEAKKFKNRDLKNTYKVIICYIDQTPSDDEILDLDEHIKSNVEKINRPKKFEQIKSFICSCMNGKKIISPCMHISATIYYLGWAKYRPLKFPAEYLNDIFIKLSDEPANNPK